MDSHSNICGENQLLGTIPLPFEQFPFKPSHYPHEINPELQSTKLLVDLVLMRKRMRKHRQMRANRRLATTESGEPPFPL